MKIEGKIQKSGNWWAVEVPLLLIFTQGKTRKEALKMAESAIEELIDLKDFKASTSLSHDEYFTVSSNNDAILMAFALKQQREKYGLSIREVASRLGSKSPTAYSRYESGQVRPNLDKFSQLLQAIDNSLEPVIKVS